MVLDDNTWYYIFDEWAREKFQMTLDHSEIKIIDLGAGSSFGNPTTSSVSSITKQQISRNYQLRVIWKLLYHFRCKTVIELGTSLGISTAYLASVRKENSVYALEGNPNFIEFAKQILQKKGLTNVQFFEGHFDNTLPNLLTTLDTIDAVFLDGNHQKNATLQYFDWILPKLHDKSIVILDDIYWSKGMTEMWNTLKKHPSVTLHIDLYEMGILFFNPVYAEYPSHSIRPTNLWNWN